MFSVSAVIEGDSELDGANWLDGAPGVAMEYKVHVDAGKEDCYYQYVHEGATLYVSQQVLKGGTSLKHIFYSSAVELRSCVCTYVIFVAGGDNAIGFAVRRPDGKIVHPYAWKSTTEYEEQHAAGGYWSFCLDNQFSKFAAKLVNLYMTTFKYDEWEKFSEELQALDVTVQTFTDSLMNVDKRIQTMRQFQQLSRGLESRDFNVLESNMSYVSTWSVVQCLVILACGFVQVHFVKKLFDSEGRKVAGAKTAVRA